MLSLQLRAKRAKNYCFEDQNAFKKPNFFSAERSENMSGAHTQRSLIF